MEPKRRRKVRGSPGPHRDRASATAPTWAVTAAARADASRDPHRAGHLEGVHDNQLFGWACEVDRPTQRARLLVGSDVGLLLEVVADEPREDVQAAGYGDGQSGFRLPLQSLGQATLVSCRWADTGRHLVGSPLALPRGFAPPAQNPSGRRNGNVDGSRDASLVGWAWDLDLPDHRARIRVASDAGHDFELKADQHRADVQAAGHGDGHVGFRVPLRRLDGASVISLRWADTDAHLFGSPLSLEGEAQPNTGELAAVAGPGWILRVESCGASSRVISGLYADLEDPNRRPLLTLEQDERVIARARACRFHPGSPGDQMHGFSFLLETPMSPGRYGVRDDVRGEVLAAFEAPA